MHLLVSARSINIGEDAVARDAVTAIKLIASFPVSHLYLDEDLGVDLEGKIRENGLVLLQLLHKEGRLPPHIQVLEETSARRLSKFLFDEADRRSKNKFWVEDNDGL